jgi:UDPglucose 6-dehydrogenase
MPQVEYVGDAYEAASGASVLVIVTEWNEFRQLDLDRIKAVMAEHAVVDCRNVYDASDFEALGFRYEGVGRGRV